MDIKKIISKLCKKYQTTSPFELARCLNIPVIFEELGTINGYYNKPFRQKQIHINCNLDEQQKLFTCAHELGHALLHPNANTPFLLANTLLSVDKLEIEANQFAAQLLISDDDLMECRDFTTEQTARLLGYSERIIKLRYECMKGELL